MISNVWAGTSSVSFLLSFILTSSCRKSGECPDGKEYHIDEKVYILDRDVNDLEDAEILFRVEHDQALRIINLAYLTLYEDCGMDEFGNDINEEDEE